jgi:hypothetical protein
VSLRAVVHAAAVAVALCLAASLAFALLTLGTRPLENTEGCLLFEAARIRDGLTLYTDPVAGAFDYGAVPARFFVLYPPLGSGLVSLFPAGLAAALGRALSLVSWYGVLAWIAWGAHRRGRPLGVLAAAFVSGVYTLTLYAASVRPDALAVALAAVALELSVRAEGAPPARAGALFALAAWLKPNVVGLAAGAFLAALRSPRRARGALGAAALVTLAIGVPLHLLSHGAAWTHLARSTAQPLRLDVWVAQMTTRPQFFALLLGFALVAGVAARVDPGVRLATLALATSVAWTLVSLAKVGSATCYWMEPCVGAAVVLAHAPVPSLSPRWRALLAAALPLQAIWTGVASVRSSVESIAESPAKARAIERLRAGLGAGSLLLSDDAGIELALDGRLVDTPFQTTALVRAGLFPRSAWEADVARPEVTGLVVTSDLLERPLTQVDEAHDRYDVEMRRWLRDEFALASREAGLFVYARR